ncbi:MAG: glycosyltransferase family 2 protein [Pseudomonadota bacterium]
MSKPTFTFIILSFNSEKYIHQCLMSINESIEEIEESSEVFVIDNGSIDNSIEIINSIKFNKNIDFQLIPLAENTGTTYSRNLAFKEAKGEYIVVLDSDAYINSDALLKLRAYLESNRQCGLAVPKIIYPDGRYQLSADGFPTIFKKIKRFLYLKEMEQNNVINEITNVDYAISAFWMLPEEVVKNVGLLDEKILYSPEDVDYCIRIWKEGYKITYLPDCKIIHDAQEISRPKGFRILNFFSFSHIKGLLYLYIKHKFIFSGKRFSA